MEAESKQCGEQEHAKEAAPTGTRDTQTFLSVAKRVSGWATNLLASGIVLIGGLVFGRQALEWWSDEPDQRRDHVREVVGAESIAPAALPQLLEFGDYPFALHRELLDGGVADALSSLRATCREAANKVSRIGHPPGPAERRMIESTRKIVPVEEVAGCWRMYQIVAPLPMVVALTSHGEVADKSGDSPEKSHVAAPLDRVVSWGLALPAVSRPDELPGRWTLFTYTARAVAARRVHDLPLPTGGRRTLSLQSDTGSVLIGVTGEGDVDRWMRSYDAKMAAVGWEPRRPWVPIGPVWHRRYESTVKESIEVQFTVADDGALYGLIMTTSAKKVVESN